MFVDTKNTSVTALLGLFVVTSLSMLYLVNVYGTKLVQPFNILSSVRTTVPNSPSVLHLQSNQSAGITLHLSKATNISRKCATQNRVVVVNYGNSGTYFIRQSASCQSALKFGASACVSLTQDFLDPSFQQRNEAILRNGFGAGLWLWKPYVIFHTLLAMEPGDFLFYLDSDWEVVSSFDPYICFIDQLGLEIVPFFQSFQEYGWSRSDAFFLMNMENKPRVGESAQVRASFVFVRRTPRAIQFVGEWLTYAQDPRIVSNGRSQIKTDHGSFRDNRQDQTVFSLLAKKWNLAVFPDPRRPFRRDFLKAHASPDNKTLFNPALEAYNPVDVDQPNHPVDALVTSANHRQK